MPGYRAKLQASIAELPRDRRPRTLISSEFVGTYRGRIPPAELAFLQQVARRRMVEHGYEADDVPMSRIARWRYRLVEFPLNAARMFAWRGREALAYRAPLVLGRRPRPGMLR
jgi:hypothetical protein